MKERQPSTEQHQQVLEVLHRDIDFLAKQIFELQEKLGNGLDELGRLVEEYQQERYRSQEEIWQSRGLIRCTLCYKVPPNPLQDEWHKGVPTPWGGWGLMPFDDIHYIEIRGRHTHRGDHYGSDHTHRHLWFHRFCTNCHNQELTQYASSGGGFRQITTDQAREIDTILASEKDQDQYKLTQALRKRFGDFDDIKVYWHHLLIPEEVYEIGTKITQEMNWGGNRLVSLTPSPSGPR